MHIWLALFLTNPAQILDADFFSSIPFGELVDPFCWYVEQRKRYHIFNFLSMWQKSYNQRPLRAPQCDSTQKANKISFKGTSCLSLICAFLCSLARTIAALLSIDQLWLKDRSVACPPVQQPKAYGEKTSQQKADVYFKCSNCVSLYRINLLLDTCTIVMIFISSYISEWLWEWELRFGSYCSSLFSPPIPWSPSAFHM